jgi:hypothetical protein
MSPFKYLIGIAALAGVLALASCGGGNGAMSNQQAGQGIAVGEPNGGAPVTADFIAQAQAANCADQRNRLFVIDKKMVFWDRAGNCPDNAYGRTLYGATPQAVLCSAADSIAGPRTSCPEEQSRALFNTILANLDKSDLGLGSGHQVEVLAVPPKAGAALSFKSLDLSTRSGIQLAQALTIRDADSFSALWSAHANGGALPLVDFSRSMVIGVFMGSRPNGCYSTSIDSVERGGDAITVRHTDAAPGANVMCTLAMTAPAHLVVVERSELPDRFAMQQATLS